MAISGYAGRALRDVPLYGGRGGGQSTGPPRAGTSNMLRRALEMRQRLADAQLAMLQEDLTGAKQRRTFAAQDQMSRKRESKRRGPRKPFALGAVDPMEEIKKLLLSNVQRASKPVTDWESYSDVSGGKGMAALLGGILGGGTGSAAMETGGIQPKDLEKILGRMTTGQPAAAAKKPPTYTFSPGEGREDYQNRYQPGQDAGALAGLIRGGGQFPGIDDLPYGNVPHARGFEDFAPPRSKAMRKLNPSGRNQSLLPSRETGGPIPKTGAYRLHKGEEVIPADVSTMIRKKLNDRTQVLGDYEQGTLGNLIDSLRFGKAKSQKTEIKPNEQDALEALIDYLRFGEAKSQRTIDEPKPKQRSGWDELRERSLGALETLAPAPFGAYEAIRDLPEGADLGTKAGAGLRGAIGAQLGQGVPMTPDVFDVSKAQRGSDAFFQGLVGPGDAPLFGGPGPPAGTEAPVPSGPPAEPAPPPADLAAALPPEGSYEAAVARVRQGDLGSRESPLALRGELSDIEQAQRNMEKMPVYREAKRKAEKAELEANRIYTMLEKEGAAMPPDQYQSLFQEADRKMKLSDKFQKVVEREEKATDAYTMTMGKTTQAILKDIIKQTMLGDRAKQLELMRQEGRLKLAPVRGLANSLRTLYGQAADGTPGEQVRAQERISEIFKIIASYMEGGGESKYKEMWDKSDLWAQDFTNTPKDQVDDLVRRITAMLGNPGTSALSETLGGLQ